MPPPPTALRFRTHRCSELRIRSTVEARLFHLERFKTVLADNGYPAPHEKADRFNITAVVSTHHASTDYHAHFLVREDEKDKTTIEILLHEGRIKGDKPERPPFAEDLVEWFVPFFEDVDVDINVNAQFVFPLKQFKSSMNLPSTISPLTNPMHGGPRAEARIMGVRIQFEPNEAGIQSVIHDLGGKSLHENVRLMRRAPFSSVDAKKLMTELYQVAISMTRGKRE